MGRTIEHLFPKAVCTGCDVELSIDKFRIDRMKPRGRATKCKECMKSVEADRHARNLVFRQEAIDQGHTRPCRNCKANKTVDLFPAAPENVGGSSYECSECFQARHARWRDDNRGHVRSEGRKTMRKFASKLEKGVQAARVRKSRLKVKYGLTEEDVASMRLAQSGRCLICSIEFGKTSWGYDAANIDHNHRTGMVRGLLCTKCNRGLGLFCDDPRLLAKAAKYLALAEVKKWSQS